MNVTIKPFNETLEALVKAETESLDTCMISCRIPFYMQEPIRNYIINGHPIGDFLFEVFCNNLTMAFARADANNKSVMEGYAALLLAGIPAMAFGSEKRIKDWKAHSGYRGLMASALEKGEKE